MSNEVQEVHGISSEFLSDKPVFAEIADSFLEFIKGNELVIHNASFDIGFLNRELEILGLDQKIEELNAHRASPLKDAN